jgi:UDP-glucose 4-epimerase
VRAVVTLGQEPRALGEIFNVGSGEEISILDLARRILARTGSASPIRLVPYDEAYEAGFEDMRRRVPNTAKIQALVGWQPSVALDQTLDEVIAHVRATG